MQAQNPIAASSDRSERHLWVVAGLIAFLLFLLFGMLVLLIHNERRDAVRRGEDRALAAAQVVATHARWITELAEQALGRVDIAIGQNLASPSPDTIRTIREAVATLPSESKAYVVAASGETVFTTDLNFKNIDIRDREYFSAVAKGAAFHTSSLLVSRLDGTQIFVFSKRLERDGRFAGAAIISFQGTILREIWQSLRLDPLSTVSFVRSDGQLVARYPPPDGPLDLSKYILFTDYLTKSRLGSYHDVSPADGVARIVGFSRVAGTDMVALASVSSEAAYAGFWRSMESMGAIVLPALLGLAGAIFWIWRLLHNDQRQRRGLVEAVALNRMLVKDTHHRVKNNMQSIMSMVRMHEMPLAVKQDLQSRISAMAAAHDHLYRLDQVSEINADALIRGIVAPLIKASETKPHISYDIDPLIIDRDHATPLALLVNEVVTNAIEHSAKNDSAIQIRLKSATGSQILLAIVDNGPGFDTAAPSLGLGHRMIQAMLTQLNGNSSYHFDKGTEFRAVLNFKPAKTVPLAGTGRF
jgi:two-component system, sensor histidine kinase PdtaS